jgi:hypothetical protein
MEKIMRKKPWFFKNGTGLGILGVVLVFGMMAAGCPTVNDDPTDNDDQPPDLTAYVGVWRQQDSGNESYWLQDDGTAWVFPGRSNAFSSYKTRWSPSQIEEVAVKFNDDKTQFTRGASTYAKNTTDKKTPAATTGSLLGTWGRGNSSIELKADGSARVKNLDDSISLKYCVETNAVYLLMPTGDLVITSIPVENNSKLMGLSKTTNDNNLAGVWKLTDENDQDYYWDMKADGSGTFYTLGASAPFSFIVTEDNGNKSIDGRSYEVSGDGDSKTLNLKEDGKVTLNKVGSVPSGGSGAGDDSSLHGAWKATMEGMAITFTFNSDGVLEQSMNGEKTTAIWKTDGKDFYIYSPAFGSFEGDGSMSYEVSGSTLTLKTGDGDMEFTKQ